MLNVNLGIMAVVGLGEFSSDLRMSVYSTLPTELWAYEKSTRNRKKICLSGCWNVKIYSCNWVVWCKKSLKGCGLESHQDRVLLRMLTFSVVPRLPVGGPPLAEIKVCIIYCKVHFYYWKSTFVCILLFINFIFVRY